MGVSLRLPPRTIAGAAGLAYVVLAAVENMEVLSAPLLGASAAEVRAAHADVALGVVVTAAGALSLACYLAFAVVLARRWAFAAVLAVALAAVGVVCSAVLVGGSDSVTISDLQLQLRYAAGPLMALVVLAASAHVPVALRRLGLVVAVALAQTPAALGGRHGVQVAAAIAFSTHALWIWVASLWLLFGGMPRAELARRAAFLMLVVAAGAVGLALLAVPGATGAFFAWTLKPSPLAAFAGGIYVASAVVYAVGIRAGWTAARPLIVAAVVLSVSVLAFTLIHLEVFDLHRLQAWAWLALFAGFAAVTSVLAVRDRAETSPRAETTPLATAIRVVFAAAALALAAAGLALWADPAAFDLPPLGGRFAGSWTVMLAVLCGWAAVRNRADEARLPALALIALPVGALAAVARTGAGDPAYVAALVALAVAGVVAQRGTAWRGSYTPIGPKPGTSTLASTPQP